MNNPALPRHFPPGEGTVYKIGQMTMTFTATAEHNLGGYTLCEAIEPPQSGASLHRHPTYDEAFIICEGNYDFQLGEKRLTLGPGDTVFVPRGTPHSFICIGPEVGRQLIISSPGVSSMRSLLKLPRRRLIAEAPRSPEQQRTSGPLRRSMECELDRDVKLTL